MARSADKTGTTGKSTRRTASTASVRRTAATPPVAAVPAAEVPSTVVAMIPPVARPAVKKVVAAAKAAPKTAATLDFAAIGKANVDALIQANTVFAQGFKALSREFFSLTQASLDSTAAATKALLAARTLPEIVALNSNFTKTQYETLVANSTRLGELSLKLATDTAAPITARVGVAA